MADNVTLNAKDYATDDIGGVHYPRNKLSLGADGVAVDAPGDATYGLDVDVTRMPGYDAQDDMLKVKSVQKKFRDSFAGATLNTDKWDSSIGTGGAVTVGSGVLTIGSGTTANAVTSVTTKEFFTIPFRVGIGLTLSQRIANQTFHVEAISVDPATGTPDGLHTIALQFDGTTATQAKYAVQNSGVTPLVSSASTFPTTASGGVYELEPFADEVWFHGATLDATTGRTNSYRRHQQIPDPNAYFKLRLRWVNGATPPASNTNAVVQYITCQDYAELTAEITAGRGQSVAGQGIGVNVIGTVPVTLASTTVTSVSAGTNLIGDVGLQVRANATGAASIANVVSAASTNATSVKGSPGRLLGWTLQNTTATVQYVKLHNIASAPTAGSGVLATIGIPANGQNTLAIPQGIAFATGIGYTIVTGSAATDATATTAGSVVGTLVFA